MRSTWAVMFIWTLLLAGCTSDQELVALPSEFEAIEARVVPKATGSEFELAVETKFRQVPTFPWQLVTYDPEDATITLALTVGSSACPQPSVAVLQEDAEGIYLQLLATEPSQRIGCSGGGVQAQATVNLSANVGNRPVFDVVPRG